MPNFRGRRFTNAHETLIWAAREPQSKSYTFNYEALKAGNDDVQMRSDWTFPLCTGEERLKERRRQETAPHAKAGGALARIILAASRPDDLISTRSAAPARPAQSPSGWAGDLSASSAKTPMRPRRGASPQSSRCRGDVAPFMTAREAPRVPFCGTDRTRTGRARRAPVRRQARDQGAGARRRGDRARRRVGSIHRIGALAQGLEACNGWTFWHIETAKGLLALMRCARRFGPKNRQAHGRGLYA